MTPFPVFLSVVFVVRNNCTLLKDFLTDACVQISSSVSDYEIIVVDNASEDDSVSVLKELTDSEGLPNIQVYALTKEVSPDTATWIGLENALGDLTVAIDPLTDHISFLPQMLEKAVNGAEVVFANNLQRPKQTIPYQVAFGIFHSLYKTLNGIDLSKEAPSFRLLNKRVINFILQHSQPSIAYRHLPATGGFARVNLEYSIPPLSIKRKKLSENIDRGMSLLISTTRKPMRLVTILSLFGAASNLIYSVYVVAVGFFKSDIAPGWISLSLQQSGMFFLFSLVLLVLGEYILHMSKLSATGPLYHVNQEFTSARLSRKEKLNLETVFSNQKKATSATEKMDT